MFNAVPNKSHCVFLTKNAMKQNFRLTILSLQMTLLAFLSFTKNTFVGVI